MGLLPGVLACLPVGLGREICAGIGTLGFWWVGRDRRLARANLERVYPEWSASKVEATARAVFRELGRNVFDFLRYPDLSPDARRTLVLLEGGEHLEVLRRDGRGAVIVTAHYGAFEILAGRLVLDGHPLVAMARPLRERRLEARLSRHRARMGVPTFPSSQSPLAAVRHLKAGGFLGVLMDQRPKSGGVIVRFFGQPTRMTEAPARLAQATGTPLVPVVIRRLADHRHEARVLDPIPAPATRSVSDLTQELASCLEGEIRACPEQWMWFHPRWPNAGGDLSSSHHEEPACAAH
ncbi:MAG TPA: lysophospholipid acyltransferase family protein [Candidatus Eisenbacteria bacterium]|nr:lysophospholipid acyltransferase family protein [Candidatus Eisenbacteria bacterium]